jgi:hemerythrin-like domain-containing protein
MDLKRHTSRILHEEHVAVLALLGRFEQALRPLQSGPPGPENAAWAPLLDQLETALQHEITRHFDLEEDQLFPRLREHGEGELAELLLEEHAAIRDVAGIVLDLLPRAARRELDALDWRTFRVRGLELVDRLGSHARMEEDALVPVVDEMLDESTDMEIWNAHAAS